MRLPPFRLALALLLALLLPPAARAAELGEPSIGDPAAPVTIIEYSSMTCPHCAAFHANTLPELKKRYIDTGKVKYILREFPLDPLAAAGFMLARCAGKDKYFGTLEQVFLAQEEVFRTGDIKAPLLAVAAKAGMTEPQFMACVTDEKGVEALNARVGKWETTAKFQVTPTFDINGKRYEGGQSLAQLDAAIAAATKK